MRRLCILGTLFSLSHCSIIIPPITLTGNRTAVERQILGNSPDLERDVWLLAAAHPDESRNVASRDEAAEKIAAAERAAYYRAFLVMDMYAAQISRYKAERIIGESNRAYLAILLDSDVQMEPRIKNLYDGAREASRGKEPVKVWRELNQAVDATNEARRSLLTLYKESRLRKTGKAPSDQELITEATRVYQRGTLAGEYIQKSDGVWIRK